MSRADRATSGKGVPYKAIPEELTSRDRWLLWDSSAETPRRPHWNGDFQISWSDPEEWHSFEEAVDAAESRESWGIGYVVTPDCPHFVVDIDGPYTDDGDPRTWFPGLGPLTDTYVEWSPGDGHHAVVAGDPPEWWRDCEVDPDLHQGVDILENKFCTVTGDRVDGTADTVAAIDADSWFTEVYHRIRGELPQSGDSADAAEPDAELSKDDVQAALSHIDPDLPHNEWVRVGYAVHAWDSGSAGRRVFEQWSKQGAKWDRDAENTVRWIWDNAAEGNGVTVGTLVYKAKENGWTPPTAPSTGEESTDTDLPTPDGYDDVDGGYAKWHPPRDSDGDGYHERITNFQLETLSRLTHDDGTREFHLRVHPADGDPYTVTCEPVVFNDLRKFRRNVLDGWTATFDGSQDDLNRLKEFVGGQDAKHRKGTKLLGLHGDEWVTPDGALTADGWADDPDTVFTDVDTPLANAFGLSPDSGDTYDCETVTEVLRLLPRTRTPERFIPVLGWFYAAPFRPFIEQWSGEFNILNILGDTGSGKTTTLETLWRAFGVDEAMPEAKATPFSIMRMLASSNALPVILDEYKPAEIREYKLNELHSNLRESTRGGVVTKGRADMGVDTYHLKAPVCISGEQPLEGPAEERRTILTVFKRDVTVGDTPEQRAFARLVGGEAGGEWYDGHDLTDHALAYYQWVLEQDDSELKSLWEECREAVLSLLEADGHTGLDDMVIQGFQTVKFGATLYRAFADSVGLDPDTTPVTADNIDKAIRYVAESGTGAEHTSHLDRLLGLLTRAASSGYLTDGEHYTVVNNGQPNAELAIHLPTAFDKVRKYARDHDVRSDDLLSSAGDYKARIKDAADDPESYVTTHSQKSPPLNRCVRIHAADAAELVDGFELSPFGVDGDASGDKTHSNRFNPVSIHDVADDPTGYPTVSGEIKTIDYPDGDDSPAVKGTLVDGSSAIDVIAWDDPDALEHGGEVIIENAATTEFDGRTQLVVREGVTTVHDAPDAGQRQIDEGVK